MPKSQPRWSTEDVLVPVEVLVPERAKAVTTSDVVEFQFVAGGLPLRSQPDPNAWVAGFWLNDLGGLLAGITVGPGGAVTLSKGRYAVCVRVHDATTVGDVVDVLTVV